ncbi:hypothetical protein DFP72DRAFT_227523 [Ephemerocybe angulata]|uniref:Secreted protein n=1 Tax=Ephemerocybe angulata TaxID=980116 RepID=A0A8H6LT87_9AGAR|nr:hypothetical protein DFP72DRAFT_227523 [Tulosesus angulatus]
MFRSSTLMSWFSFGSLMVVIPEVGVGICALRGDDEEPAREFLTSGCTGDCRPFRLHSALRLVRLNSLMLVLQSSGGVETPSSFLRRERCWVLNNEAGSGGRHTGTASAGDMRWLRSVVSVLSSSIGASLGLARRCTLGIWLSLGFVHRL